MNVDTVALFNRFSNNKLMRTDQKFLTTIVAIAGNTSCQRFFFFGMSCSTVQDLFASTLVSIDGHSFTS